MSDRWADRFSSDADPLASMASLVDVMLVFACGLIAALISAGGVLVSPDLDGGRPVHQGREIPDVPKGLKNEGGGGYESVGTVYRDPETGRLFLLEGDPP